MGVPRLFPWIKKNFPHLVKYFYQGVNLKVDNLYLDSNGLLHPCAQFIFHYGPGKSHIDRYKNLSKQEKMEKTFEHFFNTIKNLMKIVTPTKRLYIAIDGPAPLSKQAQQRERRFSAPSSTSTIFSSTEISPGTVFEFELTKYMHMAIRKEMNENAEWRGLEVIFSPPTSPGEGEHTCLDHMRNNINSQNETNCIFGPDGDLIMLALSSHLSNIYLFRQDQYVSGYYYILDFGGIRKELGSMLYGKTIKRELNDISDDFILIGFFVGNDFLPKIQMFTYLEDGLEFMISTYKKIYKDNFLTQNKKINLNSFLSFVEEVGRREKIYIFDQRKVEYQDPRFKDTTLLSCIENDTFNFALYRQLYYLKSDINIEADLTEYSETVRKMTLDYLRMIAWVFEYYVVGLPSWEDFYPWHYAPLMHDLIETLKTLTEDEEKYIFTFIKGEPPLPFVQLLSILPPSSSHLIPPPYAKLMGPKSVLSKKGIYPTSFDIDYEGKTSEHMGVVKLPFVDIKIIKAEYSKIKTKEYKRNCKSKDEIFIWDKKYKSKYISDYGTLENNHVKKI